MRIEIWSDIVCPFCYLGKRYLEIALEQLPEVKNVETIYRSFELNPNGPNYNGENVAKHLSEKYGMRIETAKNQLQTVTDSAKAVGLEYNFDIMKNTNTLDAHRLVKYAKTIGKEAEIIEQLYYAFFTDGKLISDHETLIELECVEGLDRISVKSMLENQTEFLKEVRSDEELANKNGIDVVPFIILNQKYAISGAQPIDAFVNTLKKVHEDEISNNN